MRRDAAVAGCALLLGLAWLGLSYTDPADRPTTPLAVELTAAVVAAMLVTLLRRRHSVAVVIPAVLTGVLLTASMGASLVAVYAVGAWRSGRAAAAMLGAVAVLLTVVYRFAVDDTRIWVELTVIVVSAHVVAAAVGVTVRSRRDLVGSLRERARQAEEGQRLRVEEAKHAERVVRQGAYDALEDLRSVLGMLRDGTEGERPRLGSTTCPGS